MHHSHCPRRFPADLDVCGSIGDHHRHSVPTQLLLSAQQCTDSSRCLHFDVASLSLSVIVLHCTHFPACCHLIDFSTAVWIPYLLPYLLVLTLQSPYWPLLASTRQSVARFTACHTPSPRTSSQAFHISKISIAGQLHSLILRCNHHYDYLPASCKNVGQAP